MPLLTLTTAGTAYPLVARQTDAIHPSLMYAAAVDIEIISVGGTSILTTPSTAIVCFGSPGPIGKGSAVTTSSFDLRLDGTTNTTYTYGLGNDDCNNVPMHLCYLVSDTNSVIVAVNPRQV